MMADRYLAFANRPVGRFLTGRLGLPQPRPLLRHAEGQPAVIGPVLAGAAPGGRLAAAVVATLAGTPAAMLFEGDAADWPGLAARHGVMAARFLPGQSGRAGSAVFDATGIADPAGLDALYTFFHRVIREIAPDGRIVVLGAPPETCADADARIAQRALEGFTRSLGKEARRNIAVQLVRVAADADAAALDSTLRFFLSRRSAYVSGQVVHVAAPVVDLPEAAPRAHRGRRVLVTGAARGIGAAIAEAFAREGAKVVALDVPQAGADLLSLAQRLGGSRLALDITDPASDAAILEDAATHGGYDVVVHNAGITRDRTIARMSRAEWDQVMQVNLLAPLRITEALLGAGALGPNGRIVGVSSIAGIAGNVGQTNYAATKAGVIGMVDALAPRLAARGATINAVAPGFIETRMTAAIPFAIREAGRRMNAMGQGGLPEDVAETILWLAEPRSAGVNGNIVRVCGQSLLGA